MSSTRKAELSDLEAVYQIYHQRSVIPYLSYDPMALSEFRNIFEDEVARDLWFVHEFEGDIIGIFKVNRFEGRTSHVAQIGSLALHEEYTGRGLATKMMNDLFQALQSKGVKRIELIVESDNLRAISFYEKLGFEKEGTLRNFYKRSEEDHYVDDFIMALIVD